MSSKQTFQLESIIRLNVGGQRFDTTLKTLLADRNNELFHVFAPFLETKSDGKLPPKDQDGAFFLDRDPDHFRQNLNTLRYLVEYQERQDRRKSLESVIDDDGKSTKSIGFWGRLRGKV